VTQEKVFQRPEAYVRWSKVKAKQRVVNNGGDGLRGQGRLYLIGREVIKITGAITTANGHSDEIYAACKKSC